MMHSSPLKAFKVDLLLAKTKRIIRCIKYSCCLIGVLMLFQVNLSFAQKRQTGKVESDFVNPPDIAKPWAFFWWFNGYVDKPAITKHLEELKDKGFGGAILYNCPSASIPQGAVFMSPEWRELFRYAVKEAHRLGLQMGMNICYGWPAGGKWVSPENNSWVTISSSQVVKGPQKLESVLAVPPGKKDLYKDVIVQAIPVIDPTPDNLLKITASCDQDNVSNLTDNNYFTKWTAQNADGKPLSNDDAQWLQFEYRQPQEADHVWIGGIAFDSPSLFDVQASDDGITFKTITQLHGDYLNQFQGEIPLTKARFFRLVFKAGASSNRHVDIGELAIGLKPDVTRTMQMAAKAAQNNPIGVTLTPARQQLDFVWSDLTSLPADKPAEAKAVIDITKYCTADGKISWNVPAGTWKIVRIGETTTGITAGNGLMVDYLNEKATSQHFSSFMKLLIEDAGPYAGETFKYFHEDNNEIGGPYTWTPEFIEDFTTLRGYDPKPYLITLTGELIGNTDITNRFLQDYRRTVADLVAQKHYQLLADSSKKYHVGMQAEAGGAFLPFILPHDGLMNLGKMDIPVAEFWESSNWKENQTDPQGEMTREWIEGAQNIDAKQAAIAGHIYGKRIIAAESFTSLGPTSHWYSTPADLLLHSNTAFCEGINRLIMHSSTTTKEQDGKPGYEYDAGTHFNQNVTWWKDSRPFFKFLSRCSSMLQQGLFVADVLYYNGDDVPNIVTAKHIPADLGVGYDYDACNTEVLLNRLSVKNGRLTLPDGMSYRLMVLPDTRSFNVKALRKIKQLIADGATIIGPKPDRAYGLENQEANDKEIKSLAFELWGNTNGQDITLNNYVKGKLYWGKTAREILETSNIKPDFTYQTSNKQALIDFIHRRDGESDIYYIASKKNITTALTANFRVTGKQPELWDPFTGKISDARAFMQKNGMISLPLELSPYGSTFVVFRRKIPAGKQGASVTNNPAFVNISDLSGPYHVAFDTTWGGPRSVVFNKLEDWTTRPEEGIHYYSGTARYTRSFNVNKAKFEQAKGTLILDLGKVQNTAHVWLNGKDLGVVWAPPYRLNIAGAVKTGANKLEIDVTNTWVNRLTGDARLPVSQRRTKTNIHFSPNNQLSPSGLLGPVILGCYK